jgi:hypothetical protein
MVEGIPTAESLQGKNKTRYTLADWRKRCEAYSTMCTHGIPAMIRYYEENYDSKEVLDAQGNLVSSERPAEYISPPVRL